MPILHSSSSATVVQLNKS